MNLIYSNEGFKATKFSESQSYSLDEITFFLDKKYVKKLRLYLILKDQKNHLDIVGLKQCQQHKYQLLQLRLCKHGYSCQDL